MPKIIASENALYPRIKITDNALASTGGAIHVDLEGINELLRDELGLEKDITPRYTLYGETKRTSLLGLHIPYTHTVFVQVPASERFHSASQTLIHESVHLVDSVEHKARTAGELALRLLAHKGSLVAAGTASAVLPGPLVTDSFAHIATYYNLRMGLYYRHLDPAENRARGVEKDERILEKYGRVIQIGRSAVSYPTLS